MVDEYQVPEGQVRCFECEHFRKADPEANAADLPDELWNGICRCPECAGGAGFKTEGMGYCPAAERRTG